MTKKKERNTKERKKKVIRLDHQYTLEPDSFQWVLHYHHEQKSPKTGKMIVKDSTSYHLRIEHALSRYVDDKVKKCESIEEILAKIEELKQMFKKLGL